MKLKISQRKSNQMPFLGRKYCQRNTIRQSNTDKITDIRTKISSTTHRMLHLIKQTLTGPSQPRYQQYANNFNTESFFFRSCGSFVANTGIFSCALHRPAIFHVVHAGAHTATTSPFSVQPTNMLVHVDVVAIKQSPSKIYIYIRMLTMFNPKKGAPKQVSSEL